MCYVLCGRAHKPTVFNKRRRRPLMLWLRCRASYDLREKQDYRKLATLSQTSRSIATTILTTATVAGLRESGVEAASRKLLSFTDNRQDASLQAGHLNDFVQMTQRGEEVAVQIRAGALRWEPGSAAAGRDGIAPADRPAQKPARRWPVGDTGQTAFQDPGDGNRTLARSQQLDGAEPHPCHPFGLVQGNLHGFPRSRSSSVCRFPVLF